jgi:internalin A
MRRFELCIAFPNEEGRYLIPELLDKRESPRAADFEPDECLNFEYRYKMLPEGLLPRFIVRSHLLSTRQPRWRTGVILQFENNEALVKADVQERKVMIRINGDTSARRDLLAIIRADLEDIHERIGRLEPTALVPVPEHPSLSVDYDELVAFESKSIPKIQKSVAGEVVDLDVATLLGRVDFRPPRQPTPAEGLERSDRLRVFVSYSHKDEAYKDELKTRLTLFERRHLIKPWIDCQITAGSDWRQQIEDNLATADIVIVLVSADFIASDFAYDIELENALRRHDRGDTRVIPIIVRDTNISGTPFERIQCLPAKARAVDRWDSRDTAWRNVSEGLQKAIEEIRKRANPIPAKIGAARNRATREDRQAPPPRVRAP